MCAGAACLSLAAVATAPAGAQSLTRDLFNPQRGGFVAAQDLPLRPTPGSATAGTLRAGNVFVQPGDDAGPPLRSTSTTGWKSGSDDANRGNTGVAYDALNRRRQKPTYYPGAPRPKSIGPASPMVTPTPPPARPLPPSQTAAKPPLPPALAGRVPGQPPRRQLKLDNDPFGAVGDYAGSFLIKGALEVGGGYDSNPARTNTARGSGFYKVSPELMITSDWERHALVADLRGAFTGYGHDFNPPAGTVSPAPISLDRPEFNGHVDGRIDASRDTRLIGQGRLIVGTDNPGSPNIQAGLMKYPVFTTTGFSGGIDQSFNRLQVTVVGNFDRTMYQDSQLTDGTSDSNKDRNYNQYGAVGRVSYELKPGLKPFVEVEGDTRVHDLPVDRYKYLRGSEGGYAKGGTSFELTRLLTGEVSIGYAARTYVDPRLEKLGGLLTAASLVWTVTPLTTVKFNADTTIAESPLPGVSGVFTHTYTAEVDHDLRRWLTAIGKFTYATYDYRGSGRSDRLNSIEGNLIYKLNRSLWVKGQLRYDKLDSNVVGGSYDATVVMLSVRLQN
nr:outer membrane beta-barrel protein [Rhodopseudomonas sp. WA056]